MFYSGLSLEVSYSRIFNVFMRLNPLLTSTFQTRIVEKGVERMCETTFKDIFLGHIKPQNWHNCTVKNVAYKCDFHEESLFVHLIMSSISSVWYLLASVPDVSNEYATFIFIF